MDLNGSGTRMSDILWHPVAACGPLWHSVPPCRTGLDPFDIQISDSGCLDLEAWYLEAWMLAGLEWIGGYDGGEGGIGLGGGDWKKFSHARASGARRIAQTWLDNELAQMKV